MSAAPPLVKLTVGVVIERRRATNPWIDFVWRPIAVLPGQPDAAPWTILSMEGGVTTFYASSGEIALYRSESRSYADNLAAAVPSLWIALRPTGLEPPYS